MKDCMTVPWIAPGSNSLHETFLVMDVNGNLNNTDDHMIRSETDTKMPFDNEDHNVFHNKQYHSCYTNYKRITNRITRQF